MTVNIHKTFECFNDKLTLEKNIFLIIQLKHTLNFGNKDHYCLKPTTFLLNQKKKIFKIQTTPQLINCWKENLNQKKNSS